MSKFVDDCCRDSWRRSSLGSQVVRVEKACMEVWAPRGIGSVQARQKDSARHLKEAVELRRREAGDESQGLGKFLPHLEGRIPPSAHCNRYTFEVLPNCSSQSEPITQVGRRRKL